MVFGKFTWRLFVVHKNWDIVFPVRRSRRDSRYQCNTFFLFIVFTSDFNVYSRLLVEFKGGFFALMLTYDIKFLLWSCRVTPIVFTVRWALRKLGVFLKIGKCNVWAMCLFVGQTRCLAVSKAEWITRYLNVCKVRWHLPKTQCIVCLGFTLNVTL